MKLAIIGTRTFNDYEVFKETLDHYLKKKDIKPTRIISGGADGVDSMAVRWAKENNILTTIYLPDWKTHGKAAGPLRNTLIVKEANGVIAFWNKVSRGTQDSINKAKEQKKLLNIFVTE